MRPDFARKLVGKGNVHQEKQTTQDNSPKIEPTMAKKMEANNGKMTTQQPSQSPRTLRHDISVTE